ncbi:uncharacterized protein PV09_00093 [Verruconis gallopava]|uniref:PRISE-like Rossmann-fold domain-containing protein n=1 Tax=Verruconis gallopava TaxID=253628 RepID=A0A0D2AR27_9PEZI|nr:uncharacterized protein PV09_00093 [Verruconis gallopava]KIW09158.1 hypothetical protein PV09_00093 [Verruconis gallopava]
MPGHHALVFGASGITGWSIVDQILKGYPDANTFDKVTALTNRPLSKEDTLWPESDKLQLVSGIDLNTDTQEALDAEMKSKIKDIDTVTEVYFFAYIMDPDPAKEIAINIKLLERAVVAVENLSKKLNFVVLPTGTKRYGVHLIDEFPFKNDLPCKESLPRIPEPYASQMFYYNQIDTLISLSKGKSWTWCEIIPDVIVGFVPNNNIYCLAQHLALYLSLYRHLNGEGAEVPFPGTPQSYKILHNDSFQDEIAKFSIYASLNGLGNGEGYNTSGSATPHSWSQKWPVICAYFGLKGVDPPADGSAPQPYNYVIDHKDEWEKIVKEKGLKGGRVGNDRSFGGFPYFIMTMFNFDRHVDMSKTLKAWGDKAEEFDIKQSWYTVFDRFRQAKIIP